MAHYKVVCGAEVVARSRSYEECVKIVKMHKDCKGAKGSVPSQGANKSFEIVSDPSDYPLDISGAVRLGYTPAQKEKIRYAQGMCPYAT
jgi:hypothetical protein